jgi:hypothetical protein
VVVDKVQLCAVQLSNVLKGGQIMESLLNKKVLESALNAFVIALVTQIVDSGMDITSLTGDAIGTLLNSAVAAAAWVVIRAVNPKDTKFGIGAVAPKAASKKK